MEVQGLIYRAKVNDKNNSDKLQCASRSDSLCLYKSVRISAIRSFLHMKKILLSMMLPLSLGRCFLCSYPQYRVAVGASTPQVES